MISYEVGLQKFHCFTSIFQRHGVTVYVHLLTFTILDLTRSLIGSLLDKYQVNFRFVQNFISNDNFCLGLHHDLHYYSLYYIPVFLLVKSLKIIMCISAQTK